MYNGGGGSGSGSGGSSSSIWEIVNRDRRLSHSLWSIAMAGVEKERPSRKKGRLAFLAMGANGTRIGDAMIGVSPCSHFGTLRFCSLTGGRLGASGANANGAGSYWPHAGVAGGPDNGECTLIG